MNFYLLGLISMAYFVSALFFFKFWKQTKDRFFFLFSLSFWIEGINRAIYGFIRGVGESSEVIFVVRLISYLLILAAIIDKNLAKSKSR